MSDVATITAAVVAEDPAQQAILDKHAEAIRACGERVRKRSLDELTEIGRHLAAVKKILGHGNWLPWLKREFGWSEDTAERYIALHALKRQIPNEQSLGLTITALAALGRSTTPPEAVEAVVEKVRTGERPTVNEVKATIKEAKAEAEAEAAVLHPDAGSQADHAHADAQGDRQGRNSEVEGAPPMVRRGVPRVSAARHSRGASPGGAPTRR
jgi:cell pole-organizing protein PopZ